MTIENLTTATPVEVDTVLAALYETYSRLVFADAPLAKDRVFYAANAKRGYGRDAQWDMTFDQAVEKVEKMAADETAMDWDRKSAQGALDKWAAVKAEAKANREEQAPLHAEFKRRGGWTRAYLVVTKGTGHVHSSMYCSTCYPTTQFAWLPTMSGHDESEIVEAAGERACTVCYPTAPAEVLNRPTTLFTKDEVTKQREREERAAAKAERQAAKVAKGLTPDGSEFVVRYVEPNAPGRERDESGNWVHVYRDRERREHFKTERAAVQWVVQQMSWSGAGNRYEYQRPAWTQVVEAVAAKHGKTVEEVWAEVTAKVAAKAKRDSRDTY